MKATTTLEKAKYIAKNSQRAEGFFKTNTNLAAMLSLLDDEKMSDRVAEHIMNGKYQKELSMIFWYIKPERGATMFQKEISPILSYIFQKWWEVNVIIPDHTKEQCLSGVDLLEFLSDYNMHRSETEQQIIKLHNNITIKMSLLRRERRLLHVVDLSDVLDGEFCESFSWTVWRYDDISQEVVDMSPSYRWLIESMILDTIHYHEMFELRK